MFQKFGAFFCVSFAFCLQLVEHLFLFAFIRSNTRFRIISNANDLHAVSNVIPTCKACVSVNFFNPSEDLVLNGGFLSATVRI